MSVLADQQTELAYYRDPIAIEAIDQDLIIADLTSGLDGSGAARLSHELQLTDYDHLLIASDRRHGRVVAILAAQDGKTTQEEFLLLETAFIRSDVRERRLMSRMMAALMLRIAGLASAPTVIAACTSDREWMKLFQSFGQRFTGSACFPQGRNVPVQIRSAALAQRIAKAIRPRLRFETGTGAVRGAFAAPGVINMAASGRTSLAEPDECPMSCLLSFDQLLMLIDLRTETEDGIVDDARRIYRGR